MICLQQKSLLLYLYVLFHLSNNLLISSSHGLHVLELQFFVYFLNFYSVEEPQAAAVTCLRYFKYESVAQDSANSVLAYASQTLSVN